jgi:hypothetical protein
MAKDFPIARLSCGLDLLLNAAAALQPLARSVIKPVGG